MPAPNMEESTETIPKKTRKRSSRADELKQRISDETSENSVLGLEQVFEVKMGAIKVYERQLAAISDPYAKKMLQRLIRQERQELTGLAELISLVETSPELGSLARAHLKMNYQLKSSTGRDTTFWLGALIVGSLLLPGVREKLRPIAAKTAAGVLEVTEQVKSVFSGVREDLEDLVSEAQFERFKKAIDAEIMENDSLENQEH